MHIYIRQSHTKRLARDRRLVQTGFTLVELVMVIIILGVLSVYAAPKMFNTTAVNVRGFHDSTLAYLRYAQKTAIAQRRVVCVVFGGSTSLTLTIAKNGSTPAAAVNDCSTPSTPALMGPNSEIPANLSTNKSGVGYSVVPTNFNFNGLGQPILSNGSGNAMARQTLQVVGASHSITVEPATGYVHE